MRGLQLSRLVASRLAASCGLLGAPVYRQSASLSAGIVDCDEGQLPSLDGATLVRHDPNKELDVVSRGLVLALPAKSWLVASPRKCSLLHNGHVEARLAHLLLEPTDRKSPRDLNRRLTLGRMPSEINGPSVEVGRQLTEQPIATMVGVATRERAEEVVQHALQDPP